MGLLTNIRRNISHKETIAQFGTVPYGDDRDNIYAREGYRGIYNALWGGAASQALQLTTLLSGVKIISEDVGSLPCFVLERKGGNVNVAPSHPLYARLHDSPNPDMTAIQFREAMTANALLNGDGYATIERSRGDSERIVALWPIQTEQVTRDQDRAGRSVFIHNNKTYERRGIFQVPGFGMTGMEGFKLTQFGQKTINLGLAQQDYAARFFSQDQTPNIVLKHPLSTNIDNIKAAWKAHHQGPDKWHAPAVLQEGMDVVQLKPNNRESQMVEQRTFQIMEVCRMLRLPPHKLAELGRATWANIGAQNTQYYNECLRPWLIRWEQAANLWLLGLDERYYVEHEIAGMLRGDFTQQTEGFRSMLAAGVYSINEVRAWQGMNAIPGGDEHFIQINQGTVQQVAQGMLDQQQDQPPDDNGKVIPFEPRFVRVGSKGA